MSESLRGIVASFLVGLFVVSLVGFTPPLALAASSSNGEGSNACGAGFGLTPSGCVPLACIHVLNDNDASVAQLANGDFLVTYSSGQTQTFAPCAPGSPLINTNGWVEAAYDNVLVEQISGKWTVPEAPSHNDDQTIFIFDGTENSPQTDIIQPVIQWGSSAAGGGAYWALASWYVYSSGYFVSKLININVGDVILGTQTTSHCNKSGSCDWTITGTDETLKTSTTLKVTGLDPQEHAVLTLEVYGVLSCSDYPASGSTTFKSLKVNRGTPSWTGYVFINDGCGEKVTVVNDHTVTLYY